LDFLSKEIVEFDHISDAIICANLPPNLILCDLPCSLTDALEGVLV